MNMKAKKKLEEIINLLKSKEGRNEIFVKVKAGAITARAKTIDLWNSGLKGKAIITVVALVILWVIWPSGDDKNPAQGMSSISGQSAKLGLNKLHESDALWFESDELFEVDSHCSYKVVKPNLYVLPPFIKDGMLATAILPNFEKEEGDAFEGAGLEVISVGEGHVLVGDYNDAANVWNYAFIETDDDYADGQTLKRAFYEYKGLRSVEMTDGSSKRMPAFRKLDAAYTEAALYNVKACEAAEEENNRRKDAAISGKDTVQRDAVVAAILTDVKTFDKKSGEKCIHIPPKFSKSIKVNRIPYWKWIDNSAMSELDQCVNREQFMARMGKGELPYYLKNTDRNDTPEKIRTLIKDNYLRFLFEVKVAPDVAVDILTVHPQNGVKRFDPEYSAETLFDGDTHICIVDAGFTANTCDIMGFMEAYEKKYGE